MISKQATKKPRKPFHNLFLAILTQSHISWFIYDFIVLIQCFQFFSFVYNCLHENAEEEHESFEWFSRISTYFRVLLVITVVIETA